MMNKKTLLVMGGIVAVLALCACAAVASFIFYQAGQKAADPVAAAATEISATLAVTPEDPLADLLPTEAEPVLANNQAGPVKAEIIREASTIPDDPFKISRELTEDCKIASRNFFFDLMDKKYEDAVGKTTQEMKDNGGTVETFRSIVEDKRMEPKEWTWTEITQKDQYINMVGVMHFTDGRRGSLRLELYSDNDKLLVSFLDMKPDGMTDPGPYTSWSSARKQEEDMFAIESAAGFLNGWADNKYEDAWPYTSHSLRDSLNNDKTKLPEYWKKLGITPVDWTWDNTIQRAGVAAEHPTTIFSGTVKCKEGGERHMEVSLDWEDGYWNVTAIDITEP